MSSVASIRSDGRGNLIGSLWMVLAMAAFAVEDAIIKSVTGALPVAEVLVLFGLGGAIVFAGVARLQGDAFFSADVMSRSMQVRVFFEVVGRLFYVLALALTPLSATTAILQATPIVVVLGAAVLFKEKVGWRRWSAIGVGLIGVLIILRPTADSFSVLSVLALIGMLGFAGRDLASRAAPLSLSAAILGFYGFLAILVAGLFYWAWEQKDFILPDLQMALILLAAVLWGAFAYLSLMKAMRTGSVSVVTPFRYSRLLFGIGLGILFFDETVDLPMAIGCSVVVASGLFILVRGSRKSG